MASFRSITKLCIQANDVWREPLLRSVCTFASDEELARSG